jgi:type II secretory pathway component PulJ
MTPVRAAQRRRKGSQGGLSLVELMVGIAVGLFVVAAAAMLVSTQLNENRRLLLETQVQQDLRAASDIIARELRRAGHWADAAQFVRVAGAAPQVNPFSTLTPDDAATDQVDFAYWRRLNETGPYGFKQEGNVLKTRLGLGGWQELTDGNTLRITAFTVTPRNGPAIRMPCPKLCADDTDACWPTLTVRELVVDITGQAVVDPAVQRSLRSVVRLRNDLVQFNIAGAPTQACPA